MQERVTAIILGGGRGTRLSPLTDCRSKPAVPIGSKYRLVDLPVSNCIHSGIDKIFVLTQFNSNSLHRHLHRAYPYESFSQISVELLAAQQTVDNNSWYQGTADAVRKHLSNYRSKKQDTFLILSGDHLYRMDYRDILREHIQNDADVSISAIPVSRKDAGGFGIVKMKQDQELTDFFEKPDFSENIDSFAMSKSVMKSNGIRSRYPRYLASMGIYVFKDKALREVLEGDETDFGKEVIPKAIQSHRVFGHVFSGYWRDIGTIKSFFDANIDLTSENPPFSFHSELGPIFTRARFLPPNEIASAQLKDVILGEGCIVNNAKIERSVIGLRAVIKEGARVKRSIVMGNDFYHHGSGSFGIGRRCVVQNAILDKNVVLEDDVRITNRRKVIHEDGEQYIIRDGIVIVPKGVRLKSGTRI